MSARLAERLRIETRSLHSQAERSPFMATLLRGRMTRAGYAALLRNLRTIYVTMEPALVRHASHPAIAPVGLAPLARAASLDADLASLEDVPLAPPVPATAHYAERLLELEATRPELLLAHAYVRYLGDLSGGQLLRGIVGRSSHLAGVGTAFYDFGDAAAVATLATAFRAGLAAAEVRAEDELVEEAVSAFERHRQLFDELAVAEHIPMAGAAAGSPG